MSLWRLFDSRERVALDTSVLIYLFNRHEPYYATCRRLVGGIERGELRGVISTVTEMEVLVRPLAQGLPGVVADIQKLLRRLRWLDILPVDRELARLAAALRAETRLRSLDAIVATTAMAGGCRYIVGNDRLFADRVKGVDYLVLSDYVGPTEGNES